MKFLKSDRPTFVSMVQGRTSERVIELIKKSEGAGADAYGIQSEHLPIEERTKEGYKRIIDAASGKPIYATHYRRNNRVPVSEEYIADQLLLLADSGAVLIDVMGDLYDPTEGELTMNEDAIARQKALIDKIHKSGSEVIMSSHVLKYKNADEVLAIAREHERRGADISKIVTWASNIDEEIENLKITTVLKRELKIPFLFISGGVCHFHRMMGIYLGECMALCVSEHDDIATKAQPDLLSARLVYDNFDNTPTNKVGEIIKGGF